MILEQTFSFDAEFSANDVTAHNLTTFPAVNAGEVFLITGVYIAPNLGTSDLATANLHLRLSVVRDGIGYATKSIPITSIEEFQLISPDIAFVMQSGDTLQYTCYLTTPASGDVSIKILYRKITTVSYGLQFKSVVASSSTSTTLLTNDNSSPIFIKSLFITNIDNPQDYNILINSSQINSKNILSTVPISTSEPIIYNKDQVFLMPSETLTISTASPNYLCYLSYYYDPSYI